MNRKLKKLALHRETVRNLSETEVRTVAGGITETDCLRVCSIENCRTDTCTQCTNTCRVYTEG
jgi:hypothetical protein